MSVGVVYDKDRCPDGPRTREEMEAFLARHRAPSDLMKGAVFEDFRMYGHLPFHSDTYFSTDRWALTGEAGAFTDPFYSPGVRLHCDGEQSHHRNHRRREREEERRPVRRPDRAGQRVLSTQDTSRARALLESVPNLREPRDLPTQVPARLSQLLQPRLLALPRGQAHRPDWLREEIGFAEYVVRAVTAFGEHFARMGDELRARGECRRGNRGVFVDALDAVKELDQKLGPTLDATFRKQQLDRVHAEVFAAIVERMLRVPGLAGRERVVRELSLPVALALKEVDETCLSRLLQRVAGRLTREVRERFPGEGVEQVTLEADETASESREVRVDVVGPSAARRAAIVEYARALWEEKRAL